MASKQASTPFKTPTPTSGKTITCLHCGNSAFDLIGVAGISIAGYEIDCSKCTHIQYFRKKPHQIG